LWWCRLVVDDRAGVIVHRAGDAMEGSSAVQVGVGDGFVAVGAEPAGPDPTAEELALLAAAGAEVALLARWALVDGGIGTGEDGWGDFRVGVAGPPGGLLAGVGAEAASSGWGEGCAAPGAGDHQHIVTLS